MSNKLLGYLTVSGLAAALALASPALAGGHGGGGGGGGGGHGMGGGGGGHAMGGGMGGGPMSFSAVRSGASFAAMPTTRAAVSPRFAHFGFRHHHHFRRFFFVGGVPTITATTVTTTACAECGRVMASSGSTSAETMATATEFGFEHGLSDLPSPAEASDDDQMLIGDTIVDRSGT